MRLKTLFCFLILLWPTISHVANADERMDELNYSGEDFLKVPKRDLESCGTLELDGFKEKERSAVLRRVTELPKLTVLNLTGCDLSLTDENDPVPTNVKIVLIAGGKLSQKTIRWLSKFPPGTGILFAECDVRRLEFDLPNIHTLTFQDCELLKSQIAKLVQKHDVRFTENTFHDDK